MILNHVSRQSVFDAHDGGKLRTAATAPLLDAKDLAEVYTPGVALPVLAIADDPGRAFDLTWRGNAVAIVTDGTAVLGLGDVGPLAALPVMEGKAVLMERFAGLSAVPICLDTTDVDEIVTAVRAIAPTFGGINLEDISAPRCFEIERRLDEELDIPVLHDDQHGTAIVTAAALLSALDLTGRALGSSRIVIQGAGAAGHAISLMLCDLGADGPDSIRVLDRQGILAPGRLGNTPDKERLAAITNPAGVTGDLAEAMRGADVYIGVSGGTVPEELCATLAPDAIILALANPDPEIPVDVARRHAAVVATGRSDYPNQINNVLAFPGLFRGALDARATTFTRGMQRAAVEALVGLTAPQLAADHIVPSVFDEAVVPAVAGAVATAARRDGVAR